MASDSDEVGTNKIRRRTKSVTRAEEITTKNQKQRRLQPDKPYVFSIRKPFISYWFYIDDKLNAAARFMFGKMCW